MNYKKILPFLISSAFLFAACGDDSSSTSANTSTEESSESQDSSSSKGNAKSSSSKKDTAKSSSSKKTDAKSSSSKKNDASSSSTKKDGSKSSSSTKDDASSSSTKKDDDKSSSSTPQDSSEENSSAPKLEDLEKNYELKLFDQTVYLSTGSKQGFIALCIPNEMWVVTFTDFTNGKVTFREGNVGYESTNMDAAKKIVGKLASGFSLEFSISDDDKIMYSVNGSDSSSQAIKAGVPVQKGKVSKADAIQNKIYECTDGDSTRIFNFYKSSYTYETSVDNNVANWHAGRYDIQRNTLLMLPLHNEGWSSSMFAYSVGTDNSITIKSDESLNCTVKDVEQDYENDADFVDEWVATKKDSN